MDLESVIRNDFEVISYPPSPLDDASKQRYMVIPINTSLFEVPSLALSSLENFRFPNVGALALGLGCSSMRASYKSLSASVRSAFGSARGGSLIEFDPLRTNVSETCYCSRGAVFDKDFNPILLTTWAIRKVNDEPKYEFVTPILRVVPNVLVNRNTPMERFIVNKVIPAALSILHVYNPVGLNGSWSISGTNWYKVRVVIEPMPFSVKAICPPSVSTTNEQLLGFALNNINEVIE